ncbi:hypothetical protein MMC09_001767 [Bachmanniomyces sp. S44760]|nr:hypothetical protein [Bachmanniomyces sp. S44760]
MVVRKPVPNEDASRSPNILPYPQSPASPTQPPLRGESSSYTPHPREGIASFSNPNRRHGGQHGESVSSMSDGDDAWADQYTDGMRSVSELSDTPVATDTLDADAAWNNRQLPQSLKAGQPESTPRSSTESQRSQRGIDKIAEGHARAVRRPHEGSPNNPFLRNNPYQHTVSDVPLPEVAQSQEESSVKAWGEAPNHPPPPLRVPPMPPVKGNSHGSLLDSVNNLSIQELSVKETDSEIAPWNELSSNARQPSPLISFTAASASGKDSLDHRQSDLNPASEWWDQESHSPGDMVQAEASPGVETSQSHMPTSSLPTTQNQSIFEALPGPPSHILEGHNSQTPPHPTRDSPLVPENGASSGHEAESAHARAIRQRSETYQIKQITWYDVTSPDEPRRSPIMVQNANGPCPLLALVNALTLSTPAFVNTSLIETLRVREQVSLGLLLDAVFDELMSGRRGDAAQGLPDVGELYTFLVTLHTGMNVNPRFIQPNSQVPNLIDAPPHDLPVTMNQLRQPGDFEETKEMKLYSTFNVPLIHGWLPPRNHPAYAALKRAAPSYEDAQNLMFREEELEDKLQQQGLSPQEQQILEDIATIKYFLETSATQLTGYGLDTITDSLQAGSVAILFRNDHFSTLYKHPRSGQLMTLVTDMGYAGHEEVVWESLVDVTGEGCEFFAGDFRPVGNTADDVQGQQNGVVEANGRGWTAVSGQGRASVLPRVSTSGILNDQATSQSPSAQELPPLPQRHGDTGPLSPNNEQEDHDLALAMQLQEEEEDRQRRDAAARQREDELSHQYLSSQEAPARRGSGPRRQEVRPLVPPRSGSNAQPRGGGAAGPPTGSTTVPVTVRRPDPEAGEDVPPPSYEQAAKSTPYHPPNEQPSPGYTNVNSTGGRSQGTRSRQVSAYSQHAGDVAGQASSHGGRRTSAARQSGPPIRGGGGPNGVGGAPGVARRRSGGVGGIDEEYDDGRKDCIVM